MALAPTTAALPLHQPVLSSPKPNQAPIQLLRASFPLQVPPLVFGVPRVGNYKTNGPPTMYIATCAFDPVEDRRGCLRRVLAKVGSDFIEIAPTLGQLDTI